MIALKVVTMLQWPPCKVVATMQSCGHHAKLLSPCKVVVTMQSCCHHASLATMQSCHHASVANKHTHHTLTVCDAAVNFPCQTSSHLFTSRLRTASSNSWGLLVAPTTTCSQWLHIRTIHHVHMTVCMHILQLCGVGIYQSFTTRSHLCVAPTTTSVVAR